MSYTYQDYLNYYKNNNILSDPNFEDNMICVVDVPSSFNGPNSLKFVKCKNFLDNNHSYQITIARSSDLSNISNITKNPTPYDFYAVMPKTYRSPAIFLNDPAFFTKLTISEIPKSFLENYRKNMTNEQFNILSKENWTKASNIYCKYQQDYNCCMKFMNGEVIDTTSKNIRINKSDTKSDDKNNKNKNTFFVFIIIFFILILSISVFLSLKYIRKQ